METVKGYKEVTVVSPDGSSKVVKVSKIKLRDYNEAFKKSDDEIAMTAFICGMTIDELNALCEDDSDIYETLRNTSVEVNEKGFFPFVQRQKAVLLERIKSVSPETVKLVMSQLNSSSPASVPRPR